MEQSLQFAYAICQKHLYVGNFRTFTVCENRILLKAACGGGGGGVRGVRNVVSFITAHEHIQ